MATPKGHVLPFGEEIVALNLERCGHDVKRMDSTTRDGNLLCSMYWTEGLYDLIRWRKRNSIGSKYRLIVGGNHASGYPNSILPFADGVFLGDGDDWDGVSEKHIAAIDTSPKPLSVCDIPQRVLVLDQKDPLTGRKAPIIELTRGCKMKCRFCAYAWQKPFRSAETEFVEASISGLSQRVVRLVSVDRYQHPDCGRIESIASRLGITNVSQDDSLKSLKQRLRNNEAIPKTLRFGLDGMSARLRFAMGKPISGDKFVEMMVEMKSRGVGRVLAYNIFGLPGKSSADFYEFSNLLDRIVEKVPSPFTFVVSWNAFLPVSMTPAQWEASAWNRDVRDHSLLIRQSKKAKRHGINLLHMPMATGNPLLTRRVLAMRSTAETKHIVYAAAMNGRMKESSILKAYEAATGRHLHAAVAVGDPMPWDSSVNYDAAVLIKSANAMRARLSPK